MSLTRIQLSVLRSNRHCLKSNTKMPVINTQRDTIKLKIDKRMVDGDDSTRYRRTIVPA